MFDAADMVIVTRIYMSLLLALLYLKPWQGGKYGRHSDDEITGGLQDSQSRETVKYGLESRGTRNPD
jgi:hypothetical protein